MQKYLSLGCISCWVLKSWRVSYHIVMIRNASTYAVFAIELALERVANLLFWVFSTVLS